MFNHRNTKISVPLSIRQFPAYIYSVNYLDNIFSCLQYFSCVDIDAGCSVKISTSFNTMKSKFMIFFKESYMSNLIRKEVIMRKKQLRNNL